MNILHKENEINEKIRDIQQSNFCGKKLIRCPLNKFIDKPTNKYPLSMIKIKIGKEMYLLSFLENLEVDFNILLLFNLDFKFYLYKLPSFEKLLNFGIHFEIGSKNEMSERRESLKNMKDNPNQINEKRDSIERFKKKRRISLKFLK